METMKKIEDGLFSFTFYVVCFMLTFGAWFYHRELPIPYGPQSEPLILLFSIPGALFASVIEKVFYSKKKEWWLKKIFSLATTLAIAMCTIKFQIITFDLVTAGVGLPAVFFLGYKYHKE